jgi:hypothetical protein
MASTPVQRRLLRANKRQRLLAGEPPRRRGENTSEGRKAARLASTTNGVRAPFIPVLPGIEHPADWQAFHQAIRVSLAPSGAYEEELTYRIALAFWRGRRLDRHEVAVAFEHIRVFAPASVNGELEQILEHSAQQLQALDAVHSDELLRLEKLSDGSSKLWFNSKEAEQILTGFAGLLEDLLVEDALDADDGEDIEPALEPDADGERNGERAPIVRMEDRRYSAAELLRDIKAAADAAGREWRAAWERYVSECTEAVISRMARREQARRHIAAHLVPGQRDVDRLTTYERHIHCEIRRLMALLERAQSIRRGEAVLPPLSVDVTVAPAPEQSLFSP